MQTLMTTTATEALLSNHLRRSILAFTLRSFCAPETRSWRGCECVNHEGGTP